MLPKYPTAIIHAGGKRGIAKLSYGDNVNWVIDSFGNQLAENLFDDKVTKTTRGFPPELRRAARRKLLYLHEAAALRDLEVPPGNRLEALRGNLKGVHSIRINDQWRIVFRWKDGTASDVRIVDYH